VCNGSPKCSGSISLVSSSHGVWWGRSGVADDLVAGNVEPREVVCCVLLSSVWEPTVVSDGFGRDVSPLCVRNCNPNSSSSISLVTLRGCGSWVRVVLVVYEGELRGNDPREIVG